MMVKRYPNLKEEVGGLNPGCEISSLHDRNLHNCLMCFGVGMSTFCLETKKDNYDGVVGTKFLTTITKIQGHHKT